jgi:transposase-like protein
MSMVWPCPLTAGVYASMGRAVRVPRPECPSCWSPVVFWSGYWRHVRWQGRERKIFIPRVRCRGCGVTHALLPAFVLARRLDAAEPVGAVIGQVASGACGVRPAAAAAGVPYTTARGWVRRFTARAGELAVRFSALAVELGGEVVRPLPDPLRFAVAAIGAAFTAAAGLPGWAVLGRWRFACAVTGGSLLAANAFSPFLVIGRRRFMPPRSR